MATARLRLFPRPDDAPQEEPHAPAIPVRLSELYPLLAQAYRDNYVWLRDFEDDELLVSQDLYEVVRGVFELPPVGLKVTGTDAPALGREIRLVGGRRKVYAGRRSPSARPFSQAPSMNTPQPVNALTIEWHGDVTLISATPALENLEYSLEEQVASMVMEPLRSQETPLALFDLSGVDYFGSVFLGLLLRCWKLVTAKGGMMALSGVSDRGRELLRITSLDMVWPIYSSRREAMEALLAD